MAQAICLFVTAPTKVAVTAQGSIEHRRNHETPHHLRNPAAHAISSAVALIFPPAILQAQTLTLKNADTVEAEFRVGGTGKIAVLFQFADGKPQTLLGTVKADTLKRTVVNDGKKTPELLPMADGLIEFVGAGLRFQYHSRPYLKRYTEVQQADLAKVWQTLPAASQSWVPLEIRADAAGAELWMDGRYCGRLASKSRLTEVSFKLEAGGAVRSERLFTRATRLCSCRWMCGALHDLA